MDLKTMFADTPKWQIYSLVGFVGAAIVFVWWSYLLKPAWENRDRLIAEVARLEQDILQKRQISKELPRLEAARAALQQELQKAVRRLPEEKEIPDLLTEINRLGQESGLAFTLFKPGRPKQGEFYTRIPIRMKAEGTYHSLGRFFEQIGRMERIVNITDLKVNQVRKAGGGTITGEFTATTFTFGGSKG
ncbi:MAG: type 4a pilus biogenesis protein PilO [Candidatus Methylomirabilales bacterium]